MTRRIAKKQLDRAADAFVYHRPYPPARLLRRAIQLLPRHPMSELLFATRELLERPHAR